MSKPIAVLISDVHYDLSTLKLADAAMRQAIDKANHLDVPLIVAGDLHNTKANLRGECVNAILETFSKSKYLPIVLIGNHDRINEKSPLHSLNFLDMHATLVDAPVHDEALGLHYIPYSHDPDSIRKYLHRNVWKNAMIIMHQGLEDSHMGDYIQDHSAITKDDVRDFRVISGHYHTRQDIKCGPPRKGAVGLFSYIGNPYTLSWGEASDPDKGFQILHSDGLLEFVPTNLRRHSIEQYNGDMYKVLTGGPDPRPEDLLWIKIIDTKEKLSQISRGLVAKTIGRDIFKLTLHPIDSTPENAVSTSSLSQAELLDSTINSLTNTSEECKTRLKELWRSM